MRTNSKKFQNTVNIKLEVNGELWNRVSILDDSAPDDNHYIVKEDDKGWAVIIFGDGKHGARLPTGKNIKVTFDPNKYYTGVLLQEGPVQIDNDWNENKVSSGHFYGIYQGLVIDNIDPQSLIRLLVQVPAVLGTQEVWALPCIPIGTSVVPPIGKGVWIMFESGHPAHPVWMGTWSCTK